MKLFKFLSAAVFFFLSVNTAHSASIGYMHISLLEGDAQTMTEETSDWVPAAINMPMKEGDRLWVPEAGRLELQLSDGTYVRLDENSSLDILRAERDTFQFHLQTGHIYVNFRGLKGGFLQIDTPDSSIRIYNRSIFRVDISDNGYTDISVFKGTVYADTREGKVRVYAGKTLSLRAGEYAELYPLGPVDEWERWNRERDKKFSERLYSYTYLPSELHIYSNSFDEYGRWVYVGGYGYCWVPTAHIYTGWSPYRHGRWVWIGGDYVWVSYESWGWVPYHYGRWAFSISIGWYWVPPVAGAVYWGPGFVGWVYTPAYVAWVPLAPGDIYYGYGYYGPNSINIITIDIHKTVVNVYKNVEVANAVTSLSRDTFITGRHSEAMVSGNPFLTERINIGRPQIKAEKTTAAPVLREIPASKQPPREVRDIRINELKDARPVVKEKDYSILKPEAPRKNLPVRTLKEPKTSSPSESIAPSWPRSGAESRSTPSSSETAKPQTQRTSPGKSTERSIEKSDTDQSRERTITRQKKDGESATESPREITEPFKR